MSMFDLPWSDCSQEEREAHYDSLLDKYLDDEGAETHLVSTGGLTTILTKLRRLELVDYLTRLAEELTKSLDAEHTSQTTPDLVHIRQRELPGGETMTAAILQVVLS